MQHRLRLHQLHQHRVPQEILFEIRGIQLELNEIPEGVSPQLREDPGPQQPDSALQAKGLVRENDAIRRHN